MGLNCLTTGKYAHVKARDRYVYVLGTLLMLQL